MAAPTGNNNAGKPRLWHAAICRALERRTGSRSDQIQEIDALADTFIGLCADGDLAALKEFGDRLDGKPKQTVDHGLSYEPDNPVQSFVAAAEEIRAKIRSGT